MLTILFLLIWRTVATIHGYIKAYAPANLAIAYLRTDRGLKWAIPVTLIAVPAYLFVARFTAALVEKGATEWLLLIMLVALIDAAKFASMAALAPPLWLWRRFGRDRATQPFG